MSVIYGKCTWDRNELDKSALLKMASATDRYAPDGVSVITQQSIGLAFQAFHTHSRSNLCQQPLTDATGNMVVIDGRIDNYGEIASLAAVDPATTSDASLVLSAYALWGCNCFGRFIGEWALALWVARDRILYLVRDHAGVRPLYFLNRKNGAVWSTCLETFFADGSRLSPSHEYLARSLACRDTGMLTPYDNVQMVPPSHYVAINGDSVIVRRHWEWRVTRQIIYRRDSEYDEHFLDLFRGAVKRRVGPGAPIVIELSGGMDSSSIVCVADLISRQQKSETGQLDTISYYDDTEPDWDERPFFSAVENWRQRQGIRLDFSDLPAVSSEQMNLDHLYPYPCGHRAVYDRTVAFEKAVSTKGYRTIVSGIGGDELLGGVPSPLPELADLLHRGCVGALLSRGIEWSLASRRPIIHLMRDLVAFYWSLYRNDTVDRDLLPPWLSISAVQLCSAKTRTFIDGTKTSGVLPSAIVNGNTWWRIITHLPNAFPSVLGNYEYRFPYLDRDLVEFLHRVPREQLVAPGRRRLLMRRAMKGIVPDEVVERKRKAFVSRKPVADLRNSLESLKRLFADSLLAEYGLVERDRLLEGLQSECTGSVKWVGALAEAVGLELWLRRMA